MARPEVMEEACVTPSMRAFSMRSAPIFCRSTNALTGILCLVVASSGRLRRDYLGRFHLRDARLGDATRHEIFED